MAEESLPRLAPPMAKRQMEFIWIADCSSSMAGEKIATLNQAIRESKSVLQGAIESQTGVDMRVRAIKFADRAEWHIHDPTPVESFQWPDLVASGETMMGEAIELVRQSMEQLDHTKGYRGYPPVLVLISDGDPSDDVDKPLAALMKIGWAKAATRMAVAIGAGANREVLGRFASQREGKPLVFDAENKKELIAAINFVSQSAPQMSSGAPGPVQFDSAAPIDRRDGGGSDSIVTF
jgi:uncharacterized protein YegL